MISTILEYARSGAAIQRTAVDLDEVLTHVLDDLVPVIAGRAAVVRREPLPEVVGDAAQLYAVLLNLVSNAVKFTPADRVPRIGITATREPDAWRVAVTDNGHGIPQDVAERLFSPFFSTKAEGMGMGLNICRTAIEFHGGTLTHHDNPQGGTIFTFTLPVAAGEFGADMQVSLESHACRPSGTFTGNQT